MLPVGRIFGSVLSQQVGKIVKDTNSTPSQSKQKWTPIYFLIGLIVVLFASDYLSTMGSENYPYSEFLNLVDGGQVQNVLISENKIVGELKSGKDKSNGASDKANASDKNKSRRFVTVPMPDDTLVKRLLDSKVVFRVEPRNSFFGSALGWVAPLLIFYIFWLFLFRRNSGNAMSGGMFGMAKSKAKIFVERDVKTTFSDVAGVEEAKEELQELVSFLRDPAKFSRIGGRAPKGILLVGPPGTGKTLLARAVAGEAKVPFFSINGSEFVELFVGLGAARVRDLFQDAKKQAPCIIFIDEIDALGKARALGPLETGAGDEKEQTLHQLLAEMDGFDSSEGVLILAATNRPEVLDPALLRAGRFDRQVLVNYPDQVGRLEILQVHIKKIKTDSLLSLESIAALTSGFSGADLANLVNEAALVAVRRNAESVSTSDFNQAIERVIAGLEHKKRLMNPEEKKRIAFHEMGHATVSLGLNVPEKVHKVSIIPRGLAALGYTLQRPVEDRYIVDHEELMAKVAVLMGGRASEKIFFKSLSTGASDDLVKATDLARAMVTQYAMTENLGPVSFERRRSAFLRSETPRAYQDYSEQTAEHIDVEVRRILDTAFQVAIRTITQHRVFVEEGARKLLEIETLDEHQILELWNQKLSVRKLKSSGSYVG